MSELSEIIRKRRSIRKFKADPVPRELIDQVIGAGMYAASGRGLQAPVFIAVTDKAFRDEISAENCRIGGWDAGFDPFYGAPAMVIVIAPKDIPTGIYDGSLAMGNMMLKAHELGLGSIWIHRAAEEFENGFGQKILEKVGLSGEYIGIAHLALGYKDGEDPAVPERRPGRVFYI